MHGKKKGLVCASLIERSLIQARRRRAMKEERVLWKDLDGTVTRRRPGCQTVNTGKAESIWVVGEERGRRSTDCPVLRLKFTWH